MVQVILGDELSSSDRRIQMSYKKTSGRPADDFLIFVGVTGQDGRSCYFIAGSFFIVALVSLAGLRYRAAIRRIADRTMAARLWAFSGLRQATHQVASALALFASNRAALRRATSIYAHDQRCGLVALLANLRYGTPYTYDAHEMLPFRARRYGLLRRCLEAQLERMIVRRAQTCYVVNRPIALFYRRFYGRSDIPVRTNDFYHSAPIAADPTGPPAIAYVGATGPHRRLDLLHAAQARLSCCVVLAVETPADIPPAADRVVLGLDGYEAELQHRLAGTAPYMWCVFDPAILSYRFALPNKFFQALAFGIPIIAHPDTYVGRLARRYGIGVSAEPAHLTAEALWEPGVYRRRREAVAALHDAVRAGQVRL